MMNAEYFQIQIERLVEVFGPRSYPKERARLLWFEVRDFSDDWFAGVVSYFIGNSRNAPLMPEFREEISKERERLHEIEKRKHTREAEQFMSMYSGEDIQTICQSIRDRIQGKMDDNSFEGFQKMITPREVFKCPRCQDTRVYNDASGAATLCDHRR